ncbi:MAG: hypothetical protein H7274_02945, partial [Rhodoferax sp.]|nr:hypothetical protein [Rhodoferax sp.]
MAEFIVNRSFILCKSINGLGIKIRGIWMGHMTGQLLRRKYIAGFFGLTRYSPSTAWTIVGAYLGLILASIWFGSYLVSLPVTGLSVVLMLTTSIFIGTRLRGINNIVHECCHSTFADNRQTNVLIGRVCA